MCIVLLEVPLAISLTNNARSTAISEIEHDSGTLALLVSASLQRGDVAGAQALLDRFTRAEHGIVAVVAHRKVALSSGGGVGEELADPTTKVIVRSARAGRVEGEEGTHDPDDDLLYVAIPVALDVVDRTQGRPGPGSSEDAGGRAARRGALLQAARTAHSDPSGARAVRGGHARDRGGDRDAPRGLADPAPGQDRGVGCRVRGRRSTHRDPP